jgi:hypothetical protein
MWKSTTSDVYIATRTLGRALKASVHEGGRCHVRAPDPASWRSPGDPPRFLDVWTIDPQATYSFPFGVVVPESELRKAEWTRHRDRGTVWLPVKEGQAIEIAIFLIHSDADHGASLAPAGWHTTVVDIGLHDGRRLLVVAGDSMAPVEKQAELAAIRAQAKRMLASSGPALANPRLLLTACDEKGTRRFVEVALRQES